MASFQWIQAIEGLSGSPVTGRVLSNNKAVR